MLSSLVARDIAHPRSPTYLFLLPTYLYHRLLRLYGPRGSCREKTGFLVSHGSEGGGGGPSSFWNGS
jgi:hypothetical protein